MSAIVSPISPKTPSAPRHARAPSPLTSLPTAPEIDTHTAPPTPGARACTTVNPGVPFSASWSRAVNTHSPSPQSASVRVRSNPSAFTVSKSAPTLPHMALAENSSAFRRRSTAPRRACVPSRWVLSTNVLDDPCVDSLRNDIADWNIADAALCIITEEDDPSIVDGVVRVSRSFWIPNDIVSADARNATGIAGSPKGSGAHDSGCPLGKHANAAAAPEARAAAPGDAASAMRCADTPISTDAASVAADLIVSTRAASSFAHGDEVLTPSSALRRAAWNASVSKPSDPSDPKVSSNPPPFDAIATDTFPVSPDAKTIRGSSRSSPGSDRSTSCGGVCKAAWTTSENSSESASASSSFGGTLTASAGAASGDASCTMSSAAHRTSDPSPAQTTTRIRAALTVICVPPDTGPNPSSSFMSSPSPREDEPASSPAYTLFTPRVSRFRRSKKPASSQVRHGASAAV